MLVYNAIHFIDESVQSILQQTFNDFELIILDDHSTDGTVEYLEQLKDDRIRLITKPENKGLTDSLITGLTLARGEYIARMDGDDVSLSDRFEKQVNFLDEHPDYVCCGCNYIEIPSGKKSQLYQTDEEIKVGLLSNSQFAHPTVMMRASILRKNKIGYDMAWELAEDYKLWIDLSAYGKFYNLPDYLLKYRIHDQQYSSFRKQKQKEVARKAALYYIHLLSCNHSHADIFLNGSLDNVETVKKYEAVENVIGISLANQGMKNSYAQLQKRKKQLMIRSLLTNKSSFGTALNLLISSRLFLGLKFYFSLFLGRHQTTASLQ